MQIVENNITHSSRYFGPGVVSHNVEGHHQASALLDMLEIAFNNALHFLGDPDDIVNGGFPSWLISENVLDEFANINTESIEFGQLKELDFDKTPIEGAVKQKYRIGLALESAALKICNDIWSVTNKLPFEDINREFLDMDKPARLSDAATSYTIKVLAIAIHEGYPLDTWKNDFEAKLLLLRGEKERFHLIEKETRIKNERLMESNRILFEQHMNNLNQPTKSDCFIATAAYGTEYEQKINVLRCWRDTKLLGSKISSPLVKFYYKKSPPIARFISTRGYLRALVRMCLAPIIIIIGFSVRKDYPSWSDQGNPE